MRPLAGIPPRLQLVTLRRLRVSKGRVVRRPRWLPNDTSPGEVSRSPLGTKGLQCGT
jgi:hypothetical protein